MFNNTLIIFTKLSSAKLPFPRDARKKKKTHTIRLSLLATADIARCWSREGGTHTVYYYIVRVRCTWNNNPVNDDHSVACLKYAFEYDGTIFRYKRKVYFVILRNENSKLVIILFTRFAERSTDRINWNANDMGSARLLSPRAQRTVPILYIIILQCVTSSCTRRHVMLLYKQVKLLKNYAKITSGVYDLYVSSVYYFNMSVENTYHSRACKESIRGYCRRTLWKS